ncbi:hypothetical protein SALBM217S_01391 [Streptomyces griseoloalbus]
MAHMASHDPAPVPLPVSASHRRVRSRHDAHRLPPRHPRLLAWSCPSGSGTYVDADLVVTRLGPPLGRVAYWFPAEQIPEMADLYRELYPAYADHRHAGAARRPRGRRGGTGGGRTGDRRHRQVRAQRQAAPGPPRHRARRGDRRPVGRAEGAWRCASTTRASTSATTSATCAARGPPARCRSRWPPARAAPEELREAGADIVLADLAEFPRWFSDYRRAACRPAPDAVRRDRAQHARAGHQEADGHEHAQSEHVRRERRRSEEERGHRDQSGHGADEEDDGTGTDQPVTGRGGIRLGFVTHRTRVVPSAKEQPGDVLSPA